MGSVDSPPLQGSQDVGHWDIGPTNTVAERGYAQQEFRDIRDTKHSKNLRDSQKLMQAQIELLVVRVDLLSGPAQKVLGRLENAWDEEVWDSSQ